MYYFIRANGNTYHNNPSNASCYVPGEPPHFPATYFNGLTYCFHKNIVRLGWPDVGDLKTVNRSGSRSRCYFYETLPPHVQSYLGTFRNIRVGSIILVPDKDTVGDIYIAEVIEPYHYYHNVPDDPYEHAHRLGVRWDKGPDKAPIAYRASNLGIGIRGGFWTRAFFAISGSVHAASIITAIQSARTGRSLT